MGLGSASGSGVGRDRLGVDDGGREHENVRELVVEVLLVIQGEQFRLGWYRRRREGFHVLLVVKSMCAARVPIYVYVRGARANMRARVPMGVGSCRSCRLRVCSVACSKTVAEKATKPRMVSSLNIFSSSSFLMCAPWLAWCTASCRCSEPYSNGRGVSDRARAGEKMRGQGFGSGR